MPGWYSHTAIAASFLYVRLDHTSAQCGARTNFTVLCSCKRVPDLVLTCFAACFTDLRSVAHAPTSQLCVAASVCLIWYSPARLQVSHIAGSSHQITDLRSVAHALWGPYIKPLQDRQKVGGHSERVGSSCEGATQ
jgi:hypothetical protein